MNYLEFDFTIKDKDQGELLLALLADAGFEGFEEEDDHLKAFIRESGFHEDMLRNILEATGVPFKQTVIKPQNWNAVWERNFQPIVVNDMVAIRAAFHQPFPGMPYEIIITPKMSFGTGHHATTYLMIEQMCALDIKDKTVLDFGTGTGVLAILAEKMGAKKITAIDNDDWSVENSKENIIANGCSKIIIQKADFIPGKEKYDIILANINLYIILVNLSAIAAAAKPGTIILLSGFLKNDEAILITGFAKNKFIDQNVSQKEEWLCLKVQLDQ